MSLHHSYFYNIEFNSITLSNKHWKLQQNLPFKEKETLVGSQLQVNIIADLDFNSNYEENPDNAEYTGEDLYNDINKYAPIRRYFDI